MTDKILDSFDVAINDYTVYAFESKPISNTKQTEEK